MSKNVQNSIIVMQHGLISLIGVVGNLLVLLVYTKKLKDNQTITFLIVHLAIADLACCLFLLPLNCYHELQIDNFSSDFLCKFHSFLNIINVTYSCLLMTLVAFERYFIIILPFRRVVSKLRAKIIMLALFSACLLIGTIGFLGVGTKHRIQLVYPSKLNRTNQTALRVDTKSLETLNMTFVWVETRSCFPNDLLISQNTIANMRLAQNFIVVVCFVVIFVLYALICAFVSKRRRLKAHRDIFYKEILHRSKQNTNTANPGELSTPLKRLGPNHDDHETSTFNLGNEKSTQTQQTSILYVKNELLKVKKASQLDDAIRNEQLLNNQTHIYRNLFVSNLKTAFMLFVVTLIMIVVYTPAILTSLHFLAYDPIYWNIIYVNNAANPIVYSFLNSNFRKSLKSRFRSIFKK